VPRLRLSVSIRVFLHTPLWRAKGRQPLPSLIRIYTRRTVQKVRAGTELWGQEVEEREGEEESWVVNWMNEGMDGKKSNERMEFRKDFIAVSALAKCSNYTEIESCPWLYSKQVT